jgi:hypothetical protein
MRSLSILAVLCLSIGCAALPVRGYEPDAVVADSNALSARIEASKRFSPGDQVVFVVMETVSDVPIYFYPDAYVVGKITKIKDDGYILIQWENGVITESSVMVDNRYVLAKYKPQK